MHFRVKNTTSTTLLNKPGVYWMLNIEITINTVFKVSQVLPFHALTLHSQQLYVTDGINFLIYAKFLEYQPQYTMTD